MPHSLGRVALGTYLLIAFVVLPVFVPFAVLVLEPTGRRRWQMVPFVALGVGVSTVLAAAMLAPPISVEGQPYHLAYTVELSHGGIVVVLYVVAVCGALLFSGYRHIAVYGLVNFLCVAGLAWLTLDGLTSLWCAYAALSAGAVAWHMRYGRVHRLTPYVLT